MVEKDLHSEDLHSYVKKRQNFENWGKFIQEEKNVNKEDINPNINFISEEISAGNVPIFYDPKDNEIYVVLKAGYDKEGNLKKYSVAKGKKKIKTNGTEEDLKTETAPAETYEEMRVNTADSGNKTEIGNKNYIVTKGGNKIVIESGLKAFEDNKYFSKGKNEEGKEVIEDNRKQTNLNLQGTIFSNRRMEQLKKGVEVPDLENEDSKKAKKIRIVKAIPLNDLQNQVESNSFKWLQALLEQNGFNIEELKSTTEIYKKKAQERLINCITNKYPQKQETWIKKLFKLDFKEVTNAFKNRDDIKENNNKNRKNINKLYAELFTSFMTEKIEEFEESEKQTEGKQNNYLTNVELYPTYFKKDLLNTAIKNAPYMQDFLIRYIDEDDYDDNEGKLYVSSLGYIFIVELAKKLKLDLPKNIVHKIELHKQLLKDNIKYMRRQKQDTSELELILKELE